MKRVTLILLLLCFLQLFSLFANGADKKVAGPFVSAWAEHWFSTIYPILPKHKAVAAGSDGELWWAQSAPSEAIAKKTAIARCRQAARDRKKDARPAECKVIAVNSMLADQVPWVGPPLGTPLTGDDFPLAAGIWVPHKGSELKGIVLFLHGCDGIVQPHLDKMNGEFFAAYGFDFIAPNSFAEPRPSAVCWEEVSDRPYDKTVITKLRVAQTLRSILRLRSRYPSAPIFIWGHSEGGAIAQLLSMEVAGIVVSGAKCGVGGWYPAAPPASVPILFLYGSDDPYIDGFKRPISQKAIQRCLELVRSKDSRAIVIKNSSHWMFSWRKEVAEAFLGFMHAGPLRPPKMRSVEGIRLSNSAKSDFSRYLKEKKHKAFVANPSGYFYWTGGWDYSEDAKMYALYMCQKAGGASFFDISEHQCAVIDVDGKPGRSNSPQ